MKKAVVTVLLGLVGCGGGTYNKPGATQAEFDRDLAQCRYEAASSASAYGSSETRRSASGAAGQGVGDAVAESGRRSELIDLCLRARGYSKQAGN